MKTMNTKTGLAALLAALTVAACGGGGGGGGDDSSDPSSYWTVAGHTYEYKGDSAQDTSPVGGQDMTIVAASTASADGGDKSNGEYSGSSVTFSIYGNSAGTYTPVADIATLLSTSPASKPILVQAQVGIGVNTGSVVYNATGGQVVVTADRDGKLHFNADALPAVKTNAVLGGIDGAPSSTTLTIRDTP